MQTEQAIFAAGCFWGVEAAFRKIPGVLSTAVGYTGGHLEHPNYRQVCTGRTGHAEAVLVTFDPKQVSFEELLDAFWSCHDPTTVDRQGPDIGSQYRSAIFVADDRQNVIAAASMKEVDDSKVFRRKIVTQIAPAGTFYPGEDYHQQYFEKQGMSESCHVGVAKVHTQLAKAAATARAASVV
jgi:peptide-methionine (S)-S-oxide reductase